jgi:hypothetical protein
MMAQPTIAHINLDCFFQRNRHGSRDFDGDSGGQPLTTRRKGCDDVMDSHTIETLVHNGQLSAYTTRLLDAKGMFVLQPGEKPTFVAVFVEGGLRCRPTL